MANFKIFVILSVVSAVAAQRPFYAGSRPIGYPQLEESALSNRFGDDAPIPLEARGDRNLVNRIEQLPLESRPFWYLNSKQYDTFRKNPQTWPQRQNSFIDK